MEVVVGAVDGGVDLVGALVWFRFQRFEGAATVGLGFI